MDSYVWFLVSVCALVLLQLGSTLRSILRSLQSTEAMVQRLLSHSGVDAKVSLEPSARVRELALDRRNYVAAIKAYREQTGLDLKEAKAVVDAIRGQRRSPA